MRPAFTLLWLGMSVAALAASAGATALLFLSRSNPWFAGAQNEPHYSWAVGSGRLKLWVADPGASAGGRWSNSWYRNLDGQPIRWDFTLSRGSTGGVLVLAIPLGAVAGICGVAGVCFLLLRSRVP